MVKINRALLGGSLVLLITFNTFNLLNFIFHFGMARMLTTADYGVLASLMSLVYIFGVFSEPIQTIVARYSSQEKDDGKIKNFMARFLKKSAKISSLIFLLYLALAIPMSIFLKIPYLLVAAIGLFIFSSFLSPVMRGVMQGRKMFKSLGYNLVLEGSVKLILAIILVWIGWKVYGAVTAIVVAGILAFLFAFIPLGSINKTKEKTMPTKDIYTYSWPVFFIIFMVLLFYSLDILIAKIVFDPETAGAYAIASILAKTIFLATQPISKAMFPLASENKDKKDSHLLVNATIILSALSVCALAVTYFFSSLLIRLFAGRYIPESAAILFFISIAIVLLSFANLILLYKLSLGKTKNFGIYAIFILIEAALLFLFSHNLVEFSLAFVTSSAIFLWGSILLLDR